MQSPKTLSVGATGGNVALSASHIGARWLQFYAPTGNSADALIGGDKADAPAFPVKAGNLVPYYPNGVEPMGFYFLDEIFVNVGSGDHLYVLYGG
jgi:hypothetical protein